MQYFLEGLMVNSQIQNLSIAGLVLIFLLFLWAADYLKSSGSTEKFKVYSGQSVAVALMGMGGFFVLQIIGENHTYLCLLYVLFLLLTTRLQAILYRTPGLLPRPSGTIAIQTGRHANAYHYTNTHYYNYRQSKSYNLLTFQYSSIKSSPKLTYQKQEAPCDQQATCTKVRQLPIEKTPNLMVKRTFDILVSLIVFLFILSWLTPILAIIIKLNSQGPVFFVQLRSGKNGTPFKCYKFRSMYVNGTADLVQAHKNDERLTTIGHFLRRTSIDELPQFWNVLKSEMSVIGPRPHMLLHTQSYQQLLSNYRVRLSIKPGITGWAQVNNCRGETKQLTQMAQRVNHDVFYLKNWSLGFDLIIAVRTVRILLSKEPDTY